MLNTRRLSVGLAVLTLPFALGPGCPGTSGKTDQDTNPTYTAADLSASERTAIDGATEAAAALTHSNSVTQTVGDAPASGAPLPGGGFEIGTCPVVTGTPSSTAGTFTLGVDFDTGCHPLGLTEYSCSGSASGTISLLTKTLDLTFNQLTCGADILGGEAQLIYAVTGESIDLSGTWNLAWGSGDDQVTTNGAGSGSYNRTAATSTILTFAGQIVDGGETYTLGLTNVQVSYQNNTNLIPSSGEMTVSGPIREIKVRFNSNSPSTGNVEASIDGSPFFTVNLFSL